LKSEIVSALRADTGLSEAAQQLSSAATNLANNPQMANAATADPETLAQMIGQSVGTEINGLATQIGKESQGNMDHVVRQLAGEMQQAITQKSLKPFLAQFGNRTAKLLGGQFKSPEFRSALGKAFHSSAPEPPSSPPPPGPSET